MKNYFLFSLYIFFYSHNSYSQPGEWTWMKGDSAINQYANFGTIGVPSPSNYPPSVYEPVEFTDTSGNLWLHGGASSFGTFAALWKYDIATNMWTWVSGSNSTGTSGIYGVKGVPAATNRPPHRSHGAASWVGLDGSFWMFGGISNYESRNDLWKYDPTTNMWTWMSGYQFGNSTGAYGTKGVPATYTLPPARHECVASWVDSIGNLWFFGGFDYNFNVYNDLWRYDIVTNEWTWMSGCNCVGAGQSDVYGTMGISDPANVPGARFAYAHWTDKDGNFWMFGGTNFISAKFYNDLWRYDPHINEWTWMNGPQAGAYYHYGTKCISDTADYPPPVSETRSCWQDTSDNFYLLGGSEDDNSTSLRNDLWMYSKDCNVWTWLNGNNVINDSGSYGTQGVSSPANLPPARLGGVGWKSKNGDFWLYGGNSGGSFAFTHCDLWKYVPDPDCPQFKCMPPVVNFNSPEQEICAGTCTSFLNLTANAASYQWSFPGASTSSSTSVNPNNICYPNSGNYDVQLIATNTNGGDTLLLPNYITVFPNPAPQGISQSGDTLFANQGASTYQWYYNGSMINGATDYFYVAQASGDYNVVATDVNGCEVEAAVFNVVAGMLSTADRGLLAIYPNPVEDKLIIHKAQVTSETAAEISIYNVIGEKVFMAVDCQLPTVDCRLLLPGLYYIEITSCGNTFRSKFVKQ